MNKFQMLYYLPILITTKLIPNESCNMFPMVSIVCPCLQPPVVIVNQAIPSDSSNKHFPKFNSYSIAILAYPRHCLSPLHNTNM